MGDLRTKLQVAPLPVVFVVMAVMFGTGMYFVPVLAKRQGERYDRLEAACHARDSSIR